VSPLTNMTNLTFDAVTEATHSEPQIHFTRHSRLTRTRLTLNIRVYSLQQFANEEEVFGRSATPLYRQSKLSPTQWTTSLSPGCMWIHFRQYAGSIQGFVCNSD